MNANDAGRYPHGLQLLLFCSVGIIVFLPLAITSSDFSWLLYFFAAVPVVSICLIVLAVLRIGLSRGVLIGLLLFYWLTSVMVFRHFSELRDSTHWMLVGRAYKANVLKLPTPPRGEFRHVEWDGWGFAGMDTVVYLVDDPSDSLSVPATSHLTGKFTGVPCPVYRVRRLASQWYTVAFYTETEWGHCS
jgi:hypothetical protein